jgi:hypothetical protein
MFKAAASLATRRVPSPWCLMPLSTPTSGPTPRLRGSYVRLEAMEGVVAFHCGDAAAAARHLSAAQERWQRLQVRAHIGARRGQV